MTDRPRFAALGMALLLAAGGCMRAARAGGGPENVFVVVNASSWASLTVANHFIRLRQIPPINVFYVDWTAGWENTDSETMRRKILIPALEAMEKRSVFQQIDYVVYSSDFPYVVNLSNDFEGSAEFPAQLSPSCSINSATYMWHLLLLKSPIMLDFRINHYMRSFANVKQKIERRTGEPTLGFRSWFGWGNSGELQEAG
ncbi:MAG: hypothetical protein WDZ48_09510, partial [Pirellulales bacterium]